MAYITNDKLTLAHIDALITLLGFTIQQDATCLRRIVDDNGQTHFLTSLPGARDFLVHELTIRRTMQQLSNLQ